MVLATFRKLTIPFFLTLLFFKCDPLVTQFNDIEEAILYNASKITPAPTEVDNLHIMTWNIRFGAARILWFGDSCGDRVILTDDEVSEGMNKLAAKINRVDPDIIILQEVDVESKRSLYWNQVQWLLDHTNLNYGAYASMWQTQYIPSDGLGRMDTGNAILTRWKITDAERIQLTLRGDQDALTQYFYLRRNILKVKVDIPDYDDFYVVGIHAAAFSTDDTKKQHINRFKEELDVLVASGATFVAGGDLNEIPPNSDSTSYCDEDRCPSDALDFCRDGSDFTDEVNWLNDLYNGYYHPAVPFVDYRADNSAYYTHSVVGSGFDWNRKIDYLFSNIEWLEGSAVTHQDAFELSDHAPVSGKLMGQPGTP